MRAGSPQYAVHPVLVHLMVATNLNTDWSECVVDRAQGLRDDTCRLMAKQLLDHLSRWFASPNENRPIERPNNDDWHRAREGFYELWRRSKDHGETYPICHCLRVMLDAADFTSTDRLNARIFDVLRSGLSQVLDPPDEVSPQDGVRLYRRLLSANARLLGVVSDTAALL